VCVCVCGKCSIKHFPPLASPIRHADPHRYLSESRELSLHADLTREFGLPLEDEARATIEYRSKLMAFLQQREPLFWEEQAVLVYAAVTNDLEALTLADVPRYITATLNHMREKHADVLGDLAALGPEEPLPSALRVRLDAALATVHAEFGTDGSADPAVEQIPATASASSGSTGALAASDTSTVDVQDDDSSMRLSGSLQPTAAR
jgi:hypothetical protein